MSNIGRFGIRAAQQLSRSPAAQNVGRSQLGTTAGRIGSFAKAEFKNFARDEALNTGTQLTGKAMGIEFQEQHQTFTMKLLNSIDYEGAKSALDNLKGQFEEDFSLEGRVFSSLAFE